MSRRSSRTRKVMDVTDDSEFRFLSGGSSGEPTSAGGRATAGSKGPANSTIKKRKQKDGSKNKENVGPGDSVRRSDRSNKGKRATTATSSSAPAAAKRTGSAKPKSKSNKASCVKPRPGSESRAGDKIEVTRDDGTKEIAEVLDINNRTGQADLYYEDTKTEETVQLSAISFVITEKYTEPVPQHQWLPDFSDISEGAVKHQKDSKRTLMSVSEAHSLVSCDDAIF